MAYDQVNYFVLKFINILPVKKALWLSRRSRLFIGATVFTSPKPKKL